MRNERWEVRDDGKIIDIHNESTFSVSRIFPPSFSWIIWLFSPLKSEMWICLWNFSIYTAWFVAARHVFRLHWLHPIYINIPYTFEIILIWHLRHSNFWSFDIFFTRNRPHKNYHCLLSRPTTAIKIPNWIDIELTRNYLRRSNFSFYLEKKGSNPKWSKMNPTTF